MRGVLRIALGAGVALAACATDPTPQATTAHEGFDCVVFEWARAEGISDRAAILLPVTLNGRAAQFQLDTGADINAAYGPADYWGATPDANGFGHVVISIGNLAIRGQSARLGQGDRNESEGTIGLPALMNKTVLIDYPNRQFCLAEGDQEAPGARYEPARVERGKYWVGVEVNGQAYPNFFLDTGASAFPLVTDLALWRTLTGGDSEAPETSVDVNSWGQTVQMRGSIVRGSANIAGVALNDPLVYHLSSAPELFASWGFEFPAHGSIGNAPFFDQTVVLDLSPPMRFGVVPSRIEH